MLEAHSSSLQEHAFSQSEVGSPLIVFSMPVFLNRVTASSINFIEKKVCFF